MKKKLILVLSLIALMVCLLAISVSAVEVDGIYYTLNNSGETPVAEVSTENRASCKLETVSIPATITVGGVTYKVTSIASNAFGQVNGDVNGNIKHLVIGANVSAVGEHAFRRVSSLLTVKIENTDAASGIKFHNAQFMDCTNLTKVEAKNAKIAEYGNYCFWNDSSLVTVDYPSTLTRLGLNCFRDCVNFSCGDLSNTKITEIAAWAFGSAKGITEFKFPSTLTTIGNNVFLYCPVETYVFPHSVTSIGGDTLAHQSKIKVLIMPAIDETHTISSGFLYSTRPNVVIYSGDNVEFFKSQFGSLSAYEAKPFDEYVPGTTYAKNTIFYGANKTCSSCNGIMEKADSFKFTNLVTEMKVSKGCLHCGAETVTENYAPVFECLGFSTFSNNGYCAMVQGFRVNYDSLAKYNEKLADAEILGFGVLAVAENKVDGYVFDENGDAVAGSIVSDITTGHNYFEIKVSNIPIDGMVDENTAYVDAKLYMCAFVRTEAGALYIDNGYVGATLGTAISYNDVK